MMAEFERSDAKQTAIPKAAIIMGMKPKGKNGASNKKKSILRKSPKKNYHDTNHDSFTRTRLVRFHAISDS
jgi:hypothetical protein